MHLIVTSDSALEELRRQLREGDITMFTYKQREAELPAPRLCDMPGCTREASRVDRDKALCAVCAMKARTARR